MIKLTTFEKNKINDFIRNTLKDDSLELEMGVFSKYYKMALFRG